MVPGMRPGGAPIPNFYMPMVPQGQRPAGRRGAGPIQQAQQPVPLMQQQVKNLYMPVILLVFMYTSLK